MKESNTNIQGLPINYSRKEQVNHCLYFSEVLLSNIIAWHQVLTFLGVTWPIGPSSEATTWLSVIFKNEKLFSGGKAAPLL